MIIKNIMSSSVTTTSIKSITKNTPWIEKYRPAAIDDLILDPLVIKKLKSFVTESLPNLIISGSSGIGKTSTVKCIAREIYRKYYNEAVLELNVSDDRCIKSVDENINTFCMSMTSFGNKYHKLIILDEADNIAEKTQRLINNLMEKYYKKTRFIFTCNSSDKIIEAIQSRCSVIRYFKLTDDQLIKKMQQICASENVWYEHSALKSLAFQSNGDMRYAINNLQLIFNSHGEILVDYVYKICNKPQPKIIIQLFTHLKNNLIDESISMMNKLLEQGYCSTDILTGMQLVLKSDVGIQFLDNNTKIKMLSAINKTLYFVSKGIDTKLQLMGLIAELYLTNFCSSD